MISVDQLNNVYRGPRPGAAELQAMQDFGIKRIINLESGFYQAALSTIDDPSVYVYPLDYGIEEYNMPCSDISPPPAPVIRKIFRLLADTKPTYIHCLSGVDRTGFVCAAYRMQRMDWPYAAALKEWKDLGRHWWYAAWEPSLKGYAK